jgi:hypothetical protein
MASSKRNFDPDTVSLMGRTCDEAWEQLRSTTHIPFPEQDNVRAGIAMRVLNAVAAGERDPVRLKAIALEAIEA